MTRSDSISGGLLRRQPNGGADRPIDHWLRRTLSNSYDEVLSERLPSSWVSMIVRATSSERD